MQRSPRHQSLQRESKPLARVITVLPNFPANDLIACLEHVMLTGKNHHSYNWLFHPTLSVILCILLGTEVEVTAFFILQKSVPHLGNNWKPCFCCNCVPVIRIAAFLKLQLWNKITDLSLLMAQNNSDVRGDWLLEGLLLLISYTWGAWFLLSKFELQ